MTESNRKSDLEAIDRAIALVEGALNECDEHGLIFVAIDLSTALDKLLALRPRYSAE